VLFFGKRFAIISKKSCKIKENDDEKFSTMCCRTFGNVFGKKSNVKMAKLHKPGGGGLSGVEI
jgi:hypothetical protein